MDILNTRIGFWLRTVLLLALLIVSVGVLYMLGPIPQNPSYHNFADQRAFFNIPNFYNVVSNVPFFFIGLYGLVCIFKKDWLCFVSSKERLPYVFYFIGITLIAFGSSYYHWNPNNSTLVWDRLPMTVAFMGFFSAILAERINLKFGLAALFPLIALGVASIVYWHMTELQGHGDLRLYAWVQFYPMIAIPILLLFYPARYTKVNYLWIALVLYLIAKLFEWQDKWVYLRLDHIVSGHTIKHLFSAAAAYSILLYLQHRQPKA